MKPSSIDEHLWKSYYTRTRRVVKRRGIRHRLSGWTHTEEMFSLVGRGKFNPGLKYWTILFLLFTTIVAGSLWYAQPGNGLFHNIEANPNCVKSPIELSRNLPCGDPSTTLWTGIQFADFQTKLATFGATTINLNANSTDSSIALTKTTIGDLSPVSGKNLALSVSWTTSAVSATTAVWGFYLTTNGTFPSQHGYNPVFDSSVALMVKIGNLGAGNYAYQIFAQKKQGESIGSEDSGSCSAGGSAFICLTDNHDPTVNTINVGTVLNYTGGSTSATSCAASGFGSSCSSITAQTVPFPGGLTAASSQTLPWFQFQAQQFYFGFFAQAQLPIVPKFFVGVGGGAVPFSPQFVSEVIVAVTIAPTIDTGGYFGPVIKALISIGVFILASIINFFVFLFGLAATVIIAAFDAIGNAVGVGPIGTSLAKIFSGVGSFITNVFGTIFAYVGNFATFINNGLAVIGNIIISYWTQATNGFASLANWLSNAWTVIQAIGFWFKIGFAAFLFTWMLYGTILAFEDYNRFKLEWFNATELFTIKIFGLVYWIADKSFDLLWKVLQGLKG